MSETIRESVLREASELITGDRNQTYGSPTQNFQDTADVWNVLLRDKLKEGEKITPGQVASLMVALKLVRQIAQPKRDNWVDIAGYAGCGNEVDVETGRIAAPVEVTQTSWRRPGDTLQVHVNTPEPNVRVLKEVGSDYLPYLIRVDGGWQWSDDIHPDRSAEYGVNPWTTVRKMWPDLYEVIS